MPAVEYASILSTQLCSHNSMREYGAETGMHFCKAVITLHILTHPRGREHGFLPSPSSGWCSTSAQLLSSTQWLLYTRSWHRCLTVMSAGISTTLHMPSSLKIFTIWKDDAEGKVRRKRMKSVLVTWIENRGNKIWNKSSTEHFIYTFLLKFNQSKCSELLKKEKYNQEIQLNQIQLNTWSKKAIFPPFNTAITFYEP